MPKWTKDTPTKQGWYWIKGIEYTSSIFEECEYVINEDKGNSMIGFLDCRSVHMGLHKPAVPHWRLPCIEDAIPTYSLIGCLFYGPIGMPAPEGEVI